MPDTTAPQEVHVLFHLVGDITYRAQKATLEGQLEEVFPGNVALVHEDPELQQDREVIYSLKPADGDPVAFFGSLQDIFLASARHLPSFTQVTEVA